MTDLPDGLPAWLWARAGEDPGEKGYRTGTHRAFDPNETLRRLAPLSADMGITRLANVTGLDRIGIPVVMACRPNSRSLAVTQGKGLTLAAAKASGLMEAVEAYRAERMSQPLRLARESELRADRPVVDVAGLAHLDDPAATDTRQTLWIEGFDLLTDTARWLPYECVHTDYTIPLPPRREELIVSTNGLASGNTLLEAVCHALCEVIERDATSLWRRLGRAEKAARRIDLDTIDEPDAREILERLNAAHFAVAVWDTTTDVGVPSCFALIMDQLRPLAHSGTGAGCHPCRSIALMRALTEAVQVRTTYISGARDDLSHDEFQPQVLNERHESERQLIGDAPGEAAFGHVADVPHATFAEDLGFLLARLRACGLEQAVLVEVSGEAAWPAVARVVVPGLEPDDERSRPGPRARAVTEATS